MSAVRVEGRAIGSLSVDASERTTDLLSIEPSPILNSETESHCGTQADLELVIFLPQLLKCSIIGMYHHTWL